MATQPSAKKGAKDKKAAKKVEPPGPLVEPVQLDSHVSDVIEISQWKKRIEREHSNIEILEDFNFDPRKIHAITASPNKVVPNSP